MTLSPRRALRPRFVVPFVAALLLAIPGGVVHAQPASQDAVRDAGKHFQRGVALFNEADYAGALAEFRRANEIAPNAAVLYNIGQTQFQLRSYAAALGSFERYVAQAGASAEHHAEAQTAIETLRTRVGKIDVTAPDGSEVSIDDEVVGKTPLPPVLAAVGKRKLVAVRDGRISPTRYVEVAAGETVKIELGIDVSGSASGSASASSRAIATSTAITKKSYGPAIALWTATGVLAVGSTIVGVLALKKHQDLDDARNAYDPNATAVSRRSAVDDAHGTAKNFAVVSDFLIPVTAVVAAAAIYFTILPPRKTTEATTSAGMFVKVTANGAGLTGSF